MSISVYNPYRNWWPRDTHTEFAEQTRAGRYSAIHLSTPPEVTQRYFQALADADLPLLVTADKPWFPDYPSALASATQLENSRVRFRFFDHYLYRGSIQRLLQRPLEDWLGEPVKSLAIRLFESSPFTSEAQGVTGILHDLLIHAVSICCAALPDGDFEVTDAANARHVDSDYDSETFASVDMITSGDESFPISLFAAKYMPAALAGKQMLVEGENTRLEIDLGHDTFCIVGMDGDTIPVYPDGPALPDAYQVLVDKLAANDDGIGFDLDQALMVLKLLDDAKRFAGKKHSFPPILFDEDYPPLTDWYYRVWETGTISVQ